MTTGVHHLTFHIWYHDFASFSFQSHWEANQVVATTLTTLYYEYCIPYFYSQTLQLLFFWLFILVQLLLKGGYY